MNRSAPARPQQPQSPRRDDDRDRWRSSPTQQGEQQGPGFDAKPEPQAYTGGDDERDDPRNQHFPHGDESTYGRGHHARPDRRNKRH